MQGNREGLGHCRLVDRYAIGNLMALISFGNEPLPERPLNMRHGHGRTVETHIQAMVLLAPEAVFAGIAGARRRDCDPVADLETRHAFA